MTKPTAERLLSNRVALITGASHGIGRSVALHFAKQGAELILVGRSQAALEEVDDTIRALGQSAPSLVPADLREGSVIDQIGAAIYERWKRLDVLVGNAGILGVLSPLAHIDPATWDEVIAVNLTANFRLLRSMDPLLRASPAGRGIFVTSRVAHGRAYWGGYAASKAGLEAMVRGYAQEVANTPIRVNLIEPGAIRTQMRASAYPAEDPDSLTPTDDPGLLKAFLDLALPTCQQTGVTVSLHRKQSSTSA